MSSARIHAFALAYALFLSVPSASGQQNEILGVITEIKVGRGTVAVLTRGSTDWKEAQPLLALRAGDAIRATEDAWAVVVLRGELKSVKVDAINSPLVTPSARGGLTRSQKGLSLLRAAMDYLSAGARDTLTPVVTRGEEGRPAIPAPRNGPVLANSLVFEWAIGPVTPSTVRVLSASGVLMERRGVTGGRLEYVG